MKVKLIALVIVAVVLALWVILPDPVPILVDDIIAALGSAGSVLGVIKTIITNNNDE